MNQPSKRSLAGEIGDDLKRLARANGEYADLVRSLGREREDDPADLPPLPPSIVALAALEGLHVLLVRMPARALGRLFGRSTAPGERRADLEDLRRSSRDVLSWLRHWLSVLAGRAGAELEIGLHHVLIWGLVAVGYAAVVAVLLWLAYLLLFSWP